MSDTLSLSEPLSFEGPNATLLPWNYAEVALPDVIGRGTGRPRLVLIASNGDVTSRYAAISTDVLSDPRAAVDYIARLDGLVVDSNDPLPRCFLGPETDLKPFVRGSDEPPEIFEITGKPWTLVQRREITRAVVIIDAGIAFWNHRFRGKDGSRFRGMRYLDYDLPDLGTSNELTDIEIAGYCELSNREGNAAVMRALGNAFPNSMFGRRANPSPDGFWHGTAVADLAVGVGPNDSVAADSIALFGLDLPRAVIADYDGSILTATLAMILSAAIKMTRDFAEVPLTLVMPMGFPAGPLDGSHPAALAIDRAMASAGRENVSLVLPAGNHLQDRCHARLSGQGQGTLVYWDVPPEDYSVNAIGMVGSAGQPMDLTLAAPGQLIPASVTMSAGTMRYVEQNGVKVGLLIRRADGPSWSNATLSLWETAERAGVTTPRPGRWSLSNAGEEPLDLWLARDDRDPVADRGRPRRPSYFWDAAYTRRAPDGALLQSDNPGSVVLRSGTFSVLATARNGATVAVQADERLGSGPAGPAGYSGRPEPGKILPAKALVDDGWPERGTLAAANGGARRLAISGTSAAAGLEVRRRVLPGVPPNP